MVKGFHRVWNDAEFEMRRCFQNYAKPEQYRVQRARTILKSCSLQQWAVAGKLVASVNIYQIKQAANYYKFSTRNAFGNGLDSESPA